jgi:hypothetical protein
MRFLFLAIELFLFSVNMRMALLLWLYQRKDIQNQEGIKEEQTFL